MRGVLLRPCYPLLMGVVNLVRFYRIKGTQFVRVQGLARSSHTGYGSGESWLLASGKFSDLDDASDADAYGSYGDVYGDVYQSDVTPSAVTGDVTAMYYAAPVWQNWKSVPIEFDSSFSSAFADAAVLYDKVNAVLTFFDYTRPDGTAIT